MRLVLATDDFPLVAGRAELERELPSLSLAELGTNWTLGRRPDSSLPAVTRVGRRHAGTKLGLLLLLLSPSRAKLGTLRSARVVVLERGEFWAEVASGVENGEGVDAILGGGCEGWYDEVVAHVLCEGRGYSSWYVEGGGVCVVVDDDLVSVSVSLKPHLSCDRAHSPRTAAVWMEGSFIGKLTYRQLLWDCTTIFMYRKTVYTYAVYATQECVTFGLINGTITAGGALVLWAKWRRVKQKRSRHPVLHEKLRHGIYRWNQLILFQCANTFIRKLALPVYPYSKPKRLARYQCR